MSTHLAISPRFFQTERRNYANPNLAVPRELFQNSADSRGCRNIHFFTTPTSISCHDDGEGMNREILVSKFLTMGETGKEGGETTGGFGKAKIIIAFAQKNYKITSHDYAVIGEGSGYDIEDNEFTRGCKFDIQTEEVDWARYVRHLLNRCSFHQKVFLNGEEVKSPIVRGRKVRELSFGEVWVNKSAPPTLIVRVNGVLMFSRPIQAKAQVIVEINPKISRDVLLSNRDSLVYEQQNELDEFLNELATESLTALEKKNKKFTQTMKPGAAKLARRKQAKPVLSVGDYPEMTSAALTSLVAVARLADTANLPGGGSAYTSVSREQVEEFESEEKEVDFSGPRWFDPSILVLDSNHPTYVKAAKFYDLNLTDEKTTRTKLLKIWMTILEFVVEKYTEKTGHEFSWGFGWILSESVEAAKWSNDDIHHFLLNPIDRDGKMRYSINKKADLAQMIILAAHEVAHMASKYHDEEFANVLTDLATYCMQDSSELYNLIKETK